MLLADPLISIKEERRACIYEGLCDGCLRGHAPHCGTPYTSGLLTSGAVPMTTLSNFQNHDASSNDAWKQATLVLGLLTAVAVIAVMIFAAT
jgi:hypothetical protein